MIRTGLRVLCLVACLTPQLWAEGYRVETKPGVAPPAGLSDEIKGQLADTVYQVVSVSPPGVVSEFWLVKKLSVKPGFQATGNVFYGIEPGSVVGALRFPAKGADFRGQDIPAGVYTLRFALQPETGTHIGTFDSRDFLVMMPPGMDTSLAPITDEEKLANMSSEAAKSAHAAVVPLLKPTAVESPEMKHYDDKEWWSLLLSGEDPEGGKVPLELIVVGKSAE